MKSFFNNVRRTFLTGKASAIALVLATVTYQAGAIPILVGEGNTSNNSPTTTFNFAQGLLTAYNASHDPDLPALATPPSFDEKKGYPRVDTPGSPKSNIEIKVTSDFAFVLFKWGGADKNPHEVQLFYLDGPGTYSFNAPTYVDDKGKTKQNGLSHYDLYEGRSTDVPDAGATVALLGLFIGSIGLLRRKMIA